MESAKSLYMINSILEEPNCAMINPGYIYPEDEHGWRSRTRTPWNPDNLIKLKTIITQQMKEKYIKRLEETLEKEPPILYLNCQEKGDDDIMFFLFQMCVKEGKKETNEIINAIGKRSIVVESPETWKEYKEKQQPANEEIYEQYRKLLKGHLEKMKDEDKERLLSFESDIAFEALDKCMEQKKTNYLSIYLDNVQYLSIGEQTRINRFLYARGGIQNNRRIRLKINNGNDQRKTRISDSGHRVESTHDYSERSIYEKDIE